MTFRPSRTLLAAVIAVTVMATGLSRGYCGALLVPARAESSEILGEQVVLGQLAARGYREMASLERRGGTYVLAARNARGIRMQLALDARTGEIVGQKPLVEPRASDPRRK